MDALYVLSCEFPNQSLSESTASHPLLHSRITELQVHTLLSLDFSDHQIWTRDEIYAKLCEVAKQLNPTAKVIYSNRLSDDGYFRHDPYVFRPKEDSE
jgi:hypothetical protein